MDSFGFNFHPGDVQKRTRLTCEPWGIVAQQPRMCRIDELTHPNEKIEPCQRRQCSPVRRVSDNKGNPTTADIDDMLWLWKLAAWSASLATLVVICLAASGWMMRQARRYRRVRPGWLAPGHHTLGISLVGLVVLLWCIGIWGTLDYYGHLNPGHPHFWAGNTMLGLVLGSAWSARQIHPKRPWARPLHITLNGAMVVTLVWVTATGWVVVQKYLA